MRWLVKGALVLAALVSACAVPRPPSDPDALLPMDLSTVTGLPEDTAIFIVGYRVKGTPAEVLNTEVMWYRISLLTDERSAREMPWFRGTEASADGVIYVAYRVPQGAYALGRVRRGDAIFEFPSKGGVRPAFVARPGSLRYFGDLTLEFPDRRTLSWTLESKERHVREYLATTGLAGVARPGLSDRLTAPVPRPSAGRLTAAP